MKKQVGPSVLEIVEGDITSLKVDAIVNAANSCLRHGGGVAAAISGSGGPIIQEESNLWVAAGGEVPVGHCAITSGGLLPCRYVIHAVGPRMGEGNEDEKLKQAVIACLKMAEKHNLSSIAFPAISTGIFGYPMERCARVMLTTMKTCLESKTAALHLMVCLYDALAFSQFLNEIQNMDF